MRAALGLNRFTTIAVCVALAWLIPISYALRYWLPFNASRITVPNRPGVLLLTPEGWGFFTRDPRESDMFVYHKQDNSDEWVLSSRRTGGFGRSGRSRAMEAGTLLPQITTPPTECVSDHESCLNTASPGDSIESVFRKPTLCGDVGIIRQEPVPWAWASDGDVIMPSQVTRVWVSCT